MSAGPLPTKSWPGKGAEHQPAVAAVKGVPEPRARGTDVANGGLPPLAIPPALDAVVVAVAAHELRKDVLQHVMWQGGQEAERGAAAGLKGSGSPARPKATPALCVSRRSPLESSHHCMIGGAREGTGMGVGQPLSMRNCGWARPRVHVPVCVPACSASRSYLRSPPLCFQAYWAA